MSNYLYLQHERDELTSRFNIEVRREGYTVNGLEEWRRLISLLLYVLYGEADQINERRQNIRTLILKELSEVSGSNNFNAPDQEN